MILYLVFGLGIALFCGWLQRSLSRAHREIAARKESEAELRATNEQLEQRLRANTVEFIAITEALRAEEERFRLLIDGVEDYALLMLDPEGHIVTWNAGAERTKGYQAHEILGRHFSCLYTKEDVASGKPAWILEQTRLKGRCGDEGWRVRKDGTQFYAKVAFTALRDENGELRGFAKLAHDISASRHARERFGQAVESAPNAMVIVNASGKIVLVNVQTEKLFGYTRAELMDQPIEILIPSRFHDKHPGHRTEYFTNPQVRSMGQGRDLWARRKDGKEFAVEIGLHPLSTEVGTEILCSILDITERKRAEEALRESEAQLRLFVEHAPVNIAMFDPGMRYVAASRRWVNQYGRGQNLIGRCYYDVHADMPAGWPEFHRRGLAGEMQRCEEDLWQRADGSQKWLRWVMHPWMNTSGQVGGIIIFIEDITARKRDAELLHRQQQQLSLITSNMPGPLALLDTSLRYLFVNKIFEQWFGKSVAEILGRTVEEIVGPEANARLRPYQARALAGDLITYENQIKSPAGELIYAQITVAPQRDAAGQLSNFVMIGTDITKIKLAEQALRDANEALEKRVQERTASLEAANKELDAFSYSVSHDLRAPLRAIDGFSRIVLESYAADLPADGQEFLRDIRSNTQQMGRLVDDLLTFARLSRQPVRKQPVETKDVVLSVLDTLQAAQKGRSVELRIGELPICQADAGLLRQVWFNLLANAMKYSAKRELPIIEVGIQPDSNPVIYYVRDNGVGFDMRYVHKLFGVFQRLHRAEDYEGTGVGLAIVQRVIQRHGGRIWAEAEPNRGATFFFTLPDSGSSPHES